MHSIYNIESRFVCHCIDCRDPLFFSPYDHAISNAGVGGLESQFQPMLFDAEEQIELLEKYFDIEFLDDMHKQYCSRWVSRGWVKDVCT